MQILNENTENESEMNLEVFMEKCSTVDIFYKNTEQFRK